VVSDAVRAFVRRFPADAALADAVLQFLATTTHVPTSRKNPDGHFTASACILSPDGRSTLLIFHKRLQRWLQPGGHMEKGESPVEAARREAIEETGLPSTALRLHPWHGGDTEVIPFDIDSHPIPANADKNEAAHTHHDLLFLFVADPATPLALQLEEVDSAQWVPLTEVLENRYRARLLRVAKKLRTLPEMPTIRLATAEDLPTINAIYNHYVRHSTCTYQEEPTTEAERAAWFAGRSAGHPVTVAMLDGEIVGWASLNRYHPRSAYRFTVENSVYVRHDVHRRGVGRALLADLQRRAEALGHHTVIAVISADQPASIELHRRAGFVECGLFREVGFKYDRWLDVIYLQWKVTAAATADVIIV
jgi:phosphinothricin acetyltransferase